MTNLNDMNIDYVRKVNQLNHNNRISYDYIAKKITTKVTLSEEESDEILLEILDDLLVAQSNGTTAENFFGGDLDQFVNDISEELPKRTIKSILLFGILIFSMLFSILLIIFGFADFLSWISIQKHIEVPVLSLLLIVIIFSVFSFLSTFIDSNSKNRTKVQNIIQSLAGFISYSLTYIIIRLIHAGPYINIPFYLSLLSAALLIILSIYIKKSYFPKKQFI